MLPLSVGCLYGILYWVALLSLLRLRDWDIRITMVNTEWKKTGGIEIDADDQGVLIHSWR